jgi:hypothetical protein
MDADGAPVPGAWVAAFADLGVRRFVEGQHGMTSADARGRFALDLFPGTWRLYPSAEWQLPHPLPPGREAPGGKDVVVEEGPPVGEVVLALPFAQASLGTLHVTLRGGGECAPGGVEVSVRHPRPAPGFARSGCHMKADPEGVVVFHHLVPGRHGLVVHRNRRIAPVWQRIEVRPREVVRCDIDLERSSGAGTRSLVVRCEGPDGVGLPGAEVQVEGWDEFSEGFVTGADGEIAIVGLPEEFWRADLHVTVFADGHHSDGHTHRVGQPWPERVVLRLERE